MTTEQIHRWALARKPLDILAPMKIDDDNLDEINTLHMSGEDIPTSMIDAIINGDNL